MSVDTVECFVRELMWWNGNAMKPYYFSIFHTQI